MPASSVTFPVVTFETSSRAASCVIVMRMTTLPAEMEIQTVSGLTFVAFAMACCIFERTVELYSARFPGMITKTVFVIVGKNVGDCVGPHWQ